jgi:hypothetical protein
MEPILIKIAAGNDVVETLINLAQRREAGIVILSGSGLVTDVTIHKLESDSLDVIEGLSNMTSLSGYFIVDGGFLPPPTMNIVSPFSSFSICLSDSRGQVFGGKIGGKVKAAGAVLVTAAFILNPTFHRFGVVNGRVQEMDDPEDVGGVVINDDGHAP